MSAHAAPTGPGTPSPARTAVRLGAFFLLSSFVALQYAELISDPPVGRVLGAVAIVTAGCGALALTRSDRRTALSTAIRVVLVALTLLLAVLVLGVPAHLLAPGGWHALERHLHHGLRGLEGWLWPYRGGERWARLAVLLLAPVGLLLAGAICFWPPKAGAQERRALPLAVFVALFLAGAANTRDSAPVLHGLVLLLLIGAWMWLPRMRLLEASRAGRWLVACCAVALLAEPLLSSSAPWIDYREPDALAVGGASFQWDQLYGPISWSRSAATVFAVNEPQPLLLRVTSLDRFDGLRFIRSTDPPGVERLDLGGGRAPRRAWFRHATVTLGGFRSRDLVAAGGPATASRWLAPHPPTVSREADGTITTASIAPPGSLYTVTSYAPSPSVTELNAAPRSFPAVYLPYTQFELPGPSASGLRTPDLSAEAGATVLAGKQVGPSRPGASPAADPASARRIEASPYAPMFALARRLAAGASSSYEAARRIEAYLLANYTYDEHVPAARYPLEAFLFSQRRGYCQQFSGAMTLMLRMDGIPSRVAAGFKPVLYDRISGNWNVRALDAHSWVEVFFSGIGWVDFDPTPSAPIAAGGGGESLSKSALLGGSRSARTTARSSHGGAAPVARSGAHGSSLVALTALGLGVLLVLVSAVLFLIGRLRLRRGLTGEARGAVAELREALAVLEPDAATLTLAQLEARLLADRREEAGAYVRGLRERRYARETTLRMSTRGRSELRRALAAGGSPSRRLRALLLLPPGIARPGGPGRPYSSGLTQ